MPPNVQLTAQDLTELNKQYGIDVADVRPAASGIENTTLVLNCGDQFFVLSIVERGSRTDVDALALYMRSLFQLEFPVPQIIPLRDGTLVGTIQERATLLLEFIGGNHVDHMSDDHLASVGVTLARLHSSPAECLMPPHLRFSDEEQAQMNHLADRSFRDWLLQEFSTVSDIGLDVRERVPTHGDLFPDNLIITPNGKVVLIDWQDGARDDPSFDLAMAILGLCCSHGTLFPERAGILIRSYESVRPEGVSYAQLQRTTIYVALLVALRRYRRECRNRLGVSRSLSYQAIPSIVHSLKRSWSSIIV